VSRCGAPLAGDELGEIVLVVWLWHFCRLTHRNRPAHPQPQSSVGWVITNSSKKLPAAAWGCIPRAAGQPGPRGRGESVARFLAGLVGGGQTLSGRGSPMWLS
jgi:hypothetical protein